MLRNSRFDQKPGKQLIVIKDTEKQQPENEQNLAKEELNFQTNSHAAGCFSIADVMTTNFKKIRLRRAKAQSSQQKYLKTPENHKVTLKIMKLGFKKFLKTTKKS